MAPKTSTTSLRSNKSFNNPFGLSLTQLHPNAEAPVYYVGVDVGTGSARAAIVDQSGSILGLAERPIQRSEIKPSHITQNSTEIWSSICFCVKTALSQSHIDPALVMGIGFDATCSLVAINERTDLPVGVGPDFEDSEENIILWMDHRAEEETKAINATNDKCLKYVGGQMSIEMEVPKMKWLKHHMPIDKTTGKSMFESCKFYDLADFLTHKATSLESRSYCSTTCKQGFVPLGVEGSTDGWSEEFLNKIDLPELVEDGFRRLGGVPGKNGTYHSAGESVGPLSEQAAEELGLTPSCYVGSGVIDAYAGWIGTIAAHIENEVPEIQKQDHTEFGIDRACGRLAAVAGTSTCHIAMTKDPVFVNGVWGPYRDVMAKGFWLAEGGQSCTGALLAHILSSHPAYAELGVQSESSGLNRFEFLNSRLERLKKIRGERSVVSLAKHLFFYGDFHGNRSPIADPAMRSSVIGLSMDNSLDALAIVYLGACEFIAQQTRHIVENMVEAGHKLNCVYMSGGQCRNGLLMRLIADCTGLPIVIPRYIDASVVFGAAMLGAVAAEDAINASKKMGGHRASIVSRRASIKPPEDSGPSSPYTAPTAMASTTSISAMAGGSGQYPFPAMTPIEDESKQLGLQEPNEESDSEDEATLSFGSKNNTQKDVTTKILQDKQIPQSKQRSGDKLWKVMESMSGVARAIFPAPASDPDRKLLATKYKIFLEQAESQRRYRAAVDQTEDVIRNYLAH